ncbi:FHA domain-containing protein DDL [Escovopsis weberi]|uniref:FHA domain-containing protein DDL n=1 Tax=Escovopsis weberi TaxID=150374 RepID=A0A0N0RT55_ESCWE|nr:FHA domain-containing protein DDL [Escovopsis weberi]
MASDHERGLERPRRRRDDRDGERSRHHDDSRDRQSRRSHRDKDHGRDRDRRRSSDRRRSRSPEADARRRPRSREDREDSHDPRGRRRRSREDADASRSRHRHRHRHENDDTETPEDASRAVVPAPRNARSRPSPVRRKGPLPSQQDSFAVTHIKEGEVEGPKEPAAPKERPNWGNTGRLAALSNSVAQADGTSIVLKYHEPVEARKPSPRDEWRLFVFKGGEVLDTIALGARSCWLVGREAAVVDLAAEHPSVSKQHAVIQFRHTERRNEFGDRVGRVRPYLIDLESANGTLLNGGRVPESRYLELRDKDMVQFGQSTREYVIMLAPNY